MLADALEHLVRGVVDNPDDVTVRDKQLRRGSILEVRVHPDDLGKVIGRGGRTATAFRTVVSALAGRGGARIDFVDVDRSRAADTGTALSAESDRDRIEPRASLPPGAAPVALSAWTAPWSASRSSSAGSASRTASGAR